MSGWYARVQAWLMATLGAYHSRRVADRKAALLGALRGRVVEIGPGGGVNFPFYDRGAIDWVGIEPNPFAHRRLRAEAESHGIRATLVDGVAESIPLPDASADAVVSTLVLCSVSDQQRVLAEVRRILRPGGTFVFVEHVAAPRGTALRRLQAAIRPAWRLGGGGCEPDRETWVAIATAGFARVQLDRFSLALPVVSPHIAGLAER